MDFNIEGKEYKFLLLHTHIAEDLCDHRPIYLKFKKTETCYLSETLQFEIPSAKEVERETNLMVKVLDILYLMPIVRTQVQFLHDIGKMAVKF